MRASIRSEAARHTANTMPFEQVPLRKGTVVQI